MTDDERAKRRGWFLACIDRLMAVRIPRPTRDRCVQKRMAFGIDQARIPGDTETAWARRALVDAGLETRGKGRQWAPFRLAAAASYHPETSAPAALQGSRRPTPMPAWLATGRPIPVSPPNRRPSPVPQ